MRVKEIQNAVRKQPTSQNRMQYLRQLEDAYGFTGIRGKDHKS